MSLSQASLGIDGDRLWHTLMEMAKIGPIPGNGSGRLALTGIPQEQAGIHRAQAPIKPLPVGDFTRVASQTEALAEEAAQ